eukprot:6190683-Pleurochrysis_carterae.AAC.2
MTSKQKLTAACRASLTVTVASGRTTCAAARATNDTRLSGSAVLTCAGEHQLMGSRSSCCKACEVTSASVLCTRKPAVTSTRCSHSHQVYNKA